MHLETFNQVVKTVATEPSNLPPNLLHQLPKALAACRYAIILRESVSTFFSDDHEAQQGHRHFLSLLQNWYNTLQDVQVQQQKICAESENFTHENYYDVLQTDEDYFDDEEMYVAENEALKSFKVKKKHLLEMTVANEMRMEAVCFFLELDELMESVFKVYVDVKKEKRTLVEATVVVKVAMDTASALTAQLQLKYPSLRTGEDMYNVIRNIDPDNFRHQMASIRTKYLTDLQDALRNGNGEVPYVRGMFVMDFMEVGTTLDSFLTAIPIDPTKTIVEKKVATGCGYDLSAPMGTFMVQWLHCKAMQSSVGI
ncbi:hypothetical protein PHPALM_18082 [Phytophthora palmivora]|uniref:DUF6604 domain-containing protein n=1 Tax=Phytophthora palmivora TaxID=4796 RepID=A0A2P4XKM4_9STRA|nr:hypothetical protein PHPALM_18082 [Phytophthora palmivora]